jgi:oxygen-independent coproporphyrinogen-3 oxidase
LAGIYIHIPFCKQACIYCNFHFSTSLKSKDALLEALHKEISLRKNYLPDEPVKTIYFGGGTPSLLSATEIGNLMLSLEKNFDLSALTEITLEANPDDLDIEKLKALRSVGINRLSIGVQSFHDRSLQFINRAHNAAEAIKCVHEAHESGFEDISIDLIYGIPGITEEMWLSDLDILKSLHIPHFSAYALTVEPRTVLDKWIAKGKSEAVDDTAIAQHFQLLQQWCQANGYLPYEISNYCLPGHEARHNSAYWKAESYIGFGPSAHSFDGESRQWNIANNNLYISKIVAGDTFFEKEYLSLADKCNEYVMTSLRTLTGCDLEKIKENFGADFYNSILHSARGHIQTGWIQESGNSLILTQSGRLFADKIISDLFIITDEADATTTDH